MPENFQPGTLEGEVARRRTFAIISHPDAGKTTMTEKLLLYSGAIRTAGSVKARKSDKHATSDWMEIEKQRGISVTSSAMQFEFDGFHINLLDTPGHQDFSEDTYRVLVAADSAVMMIDAAKGVEDVDVVAVELKLHGGRGDGDAALLLDFHPVGGGVFIALAGLDAASGADGARVQQQLLGHRRLTGVRVGDDGKRPAAGDFALERAGHDIFRHG